ncbi:MAG TPA: hypothetical protein VNQ90_08550 [Chthoniobacteraceae bacterium]|nr:hypothetical protein [Chthoniobacteraceae bacterium]
MTLLTFSSAAPSAFANEGEPPERTRARLISGPVKVDGDVEKEAYPSGPWEGRFVQAGRWNHEYDSTDQLGIARHQSRFRVATDGARLYLLAQLEEPGGKVVATARQPSDPVGRDDSLEIYLQANDDEADFFCVIVTAGGVVVGKEYGQGGLVRAEWKTQTQAAVKLLPDRWEVEAAIPLHELQLDPALDTWRLQVVRKRAAREEGAEMEISSWSPSPRSVDLPEGFGFLAMPEFDRSIFGWKLKGKPAVALTRNGRPVLEQEVTIENRTGKAQTVELHSLVETAAPGETAPRSIRKITLQEGQQKSLQVELASEATLPKEGSILHRLALPKSPDRVLAEWRIPELPEYLYGELTLLEPGYRNAIFATQKIATLRARLRRIDISIPFAPEVTLLPEGEGEPIAGKVEPVGENEWAITVPGIAALPEGRYTLEVKVDAERRLTQPVRKLPYRAGEIWIDARGIVHRDGKPFPAYGFHYGRWRELERTLPPELSINLFFPVVEPRASQEEISEGTANLARQGIYSGLWSPGPSRESREEGTLTEADREKYRALATAFADRPEVVLYYLSDEPEINGVPPALLEEISAIYREEDPWRPTVVTNNTVLGVRQYQYGVDISNPDPYPVFRNRRGSSRRLNVGARYLDEITVGEPSHRARWVTPEAFWFYRVAESRPPSAREMRSQQVISLIHGATGITWYREQAYWDSPGIQSSLPYLAREYHALFPWLVEGEQEILPSEETLEVGWWTRGGEALLLVVNAEWKEREVSLNDPRFKGVAQWKALGGGSAPAGGGETLRLTLKPYESRIFASANAAFPDDLDWKAVETAEQRVIEASIRPGNIAHRSTGTTVRGIKVPPRSEASLIAVIDGMKDPRGFGFRYPEFSRGMGLELDFGQVRKPRRVRLIGTNIRSGRVLISTGQEWKEAARFTAGEPAATIDVPLEGGPTRGLRLVVDAVQRGDGFLQIHEIEADE